MAGISGNAEVGAWSVALSGGYADECVLPFRRLQSHHRAKLSVDLGEAFTYTGSGGRDLKGTKQNPKNLRTAPQSFDQSFKNSFNAALKVGLVDIYCTAWPGLVAVLAPYEVTAVRVMAKEADCLEIRGNT